MGDVEVMEVLDGTGYLPNLQSHLLLCQLVGPFAKELKQSPLLHVLKHKIDVLFVVKKAIEAEYVGMVQVRLQFDLQGQLVLQHVGLDYLLGDLLDRVERVRHGMGCDIYNPEFTLALGFS